MISVFVQNIVCADIGPKIKSIPKPKKSMSEQSIRPVCEPSEHRIWKRLPHRIIDREYPEAYRETLVVLEITRTTDFSASNR